MLIYNSYTSIGQTKIPDGFVCLQDIDSSFVIELRYASSNNFLGTPVNGYLSNKLYLTKEAAKALITVQKELNSLGFGLKIYDAYRPQRAVNHFKKWAKTPNDTLTKNDYYPDLNKKDLFRLGFIASHSGHSRGSTVDLTLIDFETKEEIDMGSPFDFFGAISHSKYKNISNIQRKNRALLRALMIKNNFRPYNKEWWHFNLRNEPFPNTYFDFPIE